MLRRLAARMHLMHTLITLPAPPTPAPISSTTTTTQVTRPDQTRQGWHCVGFPRHQCIYFMPRHEIAQARFLFLHSMFTFYISGCAHSARQEGGGARGEWVVSILSLAHLHTLPFDHDRCGNRLQCPPLVIAFRYAWHPRMQFAMFSHVPVMPSSLPRKASEISPVAPPPS